MYVHAELHGASSTIIKNHDATKPVPPLTLQQVCTVWGGGGGGLQCRSHCAAPAAVSGVPPPPDGISGAALVWECAGGVRLRVPQQGLGQQAGDQRLVGASPSGAGRQLAGSWREAGGQLAGSWRAAGGAVALGPCAWVHAEADGRPCMRWAWPTSSDSASPSPPPPPPPPSAGVQDRPHGRVPDSRLLHDPRPQELPAATGGSPPPLPRVQLWLPVQP